jgi:poly-gamma-glutamate capsule biosynthesis protein CapA/YwtB (metallophosphatase superfamily)
VLRLVLAGDVMLGRGVDEALRGMGPEEPWGDLLPLLHDADVRVVNLECAITAHERPWSRAPKAFHFRASPSAAAALRAARIDACSLANNHVLDFEAPGLLDTIGHLDRAGIGHAGAGRDLGEASRPALVSAGAGRVALASATDNEPAFAAGRDRPGTNYLPVSLEPSVLARVGAMLSAARQAGADTVVFSNHWGPNMRERPTARFQAFARAVIDLGADVYHGHSAHLVQGVEIYRDKPILYDTGDFLDDYAVDPVLRNDWSFLFRLAMDGGRLVAMELVPVKLGFARVGRAGGQEREAILDRMERLSGDLGTAFARREGRLELVPGTA